MLLYDSYSLELAEPGFCITSIGRVLREFDRNDSDLSTEDQTLFVHTNKIFVQVVQFQIVLDDIYQRATHINRRNHPSLA